MNATQPFFFLRVIYSSLRRNCADLLLPWYIQRLDVIPILMPDPVASTSIFMSDDASRGAPQALRLAASVGINYPPNMVVRSPNRPVSVRIKARPYLEQVRFDPPPKHSSSLPISLSAFMQAVEEAIVPPPASCLFPSKHHCPPHCPPIRAQFFTYGSWHSRLYNGMKPLSCTLQHILGFHRRTIP